VVLWNINNLSQKKKRYALGASQKKGKLTKVLLIDSASATTGTGKNNAHRNTIYGAVGGALFIKER
jgi:hypothetical protein